MWNMAAGGRWVALSPKGQSEGEKADTLPLDYTGAHYIPAACYRCSFGGVAYLRQSYKAFGIPFPPKG